MYFSNTRWTQLLAPLEIIMDKISLKYIPIHIHNWALQGDYEHEIIQPWLPVSEKYKYSLNSLNHPSQWKNKNKKYISDVQQKIIELHKLVKWL